MSERSERKKKFFFELLLWSSSAPESRYVGSARRLIAVAVGGGAGAAVVEGESGAKLRSGVTRGRGCGRCGVARVLDRLSKFFPDQIIGVSGNIAAGGRVRYVQPSPGLVIGRGACVTGARFGAVICIGSAGFDLAPRFASVWSRCAVLPRSPMANTCSRLRLYSACAAVSSGSSSRNTAMMSSRWIAHVDLCALMMLRKFSPSGGIGLHSDAMKWNIRRQSIPKAAAGNVNASGCIIKRSMAKAGSRFGNGFFSIRQK